jgi:hypothetical protein
MEGIENGAEAGAVDRQHCGGQVGYVEAGRESISLPAVSAGSPM